MYQSLNDVLAPLLALGSLQSAIMQLC